MKKVLIGCGIAAGVLIIALIIVGVIVAKKVGQLAKSDPSITAQSLGMDPYDNSKFTYGKNIDLKLIKEGTGIRMAAYTTSDSYETVISYYKEKYPKAVVNTSNKNGRDTTSFMLKQSEKSTDSQAKPGQENTGAPTNSTADKEIKMITVSNDPNQVVIVYMIMKGDTAKAQENIPDIKP